MFTKKNMINNMINKSFTYAIIGASNNTEKYGYKIFKDLKDAGYKVIPIHPTEKEIEGVSVYNSLASSPERIDIVISVVPGSITEKICQEMKILGIKNIWMQPGAQSDTAILFCEENGINVVHDSCIMIQRKK